MEINTRQMSIKNRPDYFFDDNQIVNDKYFDSSLLETNTLLFKGVFSFNIYYIKYIPTKSPNLESIDRTDKVEDFLYLFLNDVDWNLEENDGIKYLVFASTGKSKEALKNYTKLWKETKRQIEVINDDKPIEYRKDFMKIKFASGDDLSLGKAVNILDMIIIAASVLERNDKYYPQIFFHECGYKL